MVLTVVQRAEHGLTSKVMITQAARAQARIAHQMIKIHMPAITALTEIPGVLGPVLLSASKSIEHPDPQHNGQKQNKRHGKDRIKIPDEH